MTTTASQENPGAHSSADESVTMPPPTTEEIIACFLARELRDGERVAVGANLPVPRCGALLAHRQHGPNMRLLISMTFTNVLHEPVVPALPTAMDFRGTRWAEAYIRHDETLTDIRHLADTFTIGALQVDPYGNSNLLGRADADGRLVMRGPGALATPTMADHVSRFYIMVNRHTPEVFVERCDFVSCFGWGRPELPGSSRAELGLPGGGPRYCISPLAVLDFSGPSHRMRLRSVHPGVTVEEVVARTGFPLENPDGVPTTELPSPAELYLLRKYVDTTGMLRQAQD